MSDSVRPRPKFTRVKRFLTIAGRRKYQAERRLLTVALLLLLTALLVEVLAARLWYTDGQAQPRRVVFEYVKFVFIFFLTGQSLGFIRVVNKEARENAGTSGYFGLDRKAGGGTILFVLPVFEAHEKTEILRRKGGDEDSERFGIYPPTDKRLDDKLLGTLCRYDVVAAMELSSLFRNAGGDDFMVIDDRTFLRYLADQPPDARKLSVKRNDLPVEITSVVVIGLWSNLVTTMLAGNSTFWQLNDMKSQLQGGRVIRSLLVGAEQFLVSYDSETAQSEGEPVVILRRPYEEFTLSLLGGVSGVGTLRVGDFLLRGQNELEAFLEPYRNMAGNMFETVVRGRSKNTKVTRTTKVTTSIVWQTRKANSLEPTSFSQAFKQDAQMILGKRPTDEMFARDPLATRWLESRRNSGDLGPGESELP